jgi:adenosyl cobinamide kinase/adenosyl cobinamide phosphate guanylyltransferase
VLDSSVKAHRLILITGGARAGKSRFAEALASDLGGDDVGFVATAEALDDDMRRRIAVHREQRPRSWRTIEEPLDLAAALERFVPAPPRALLIDCLTLWVSNLLLRAGDDPSSEASVNDATTRLVAAAHAIPSHVIAVTNEVGLGIVPPTELGRRYRDLLGRVNQRIAGVATDVYLVVAGIPIDLRAFATHRCELEE